MFDSKLVFQKRGQSALEFLVTYAWAFIVIAIVIAAIAYFGVLRPQRVLPDRCTFNVAFDCQAYSINTAGDLRLRLKNGVGTTITVTPNGLTVTKEDGTPFIGCVLTSAVPTNWALGGVENILWQTCDLTTAGFSAGDKAKLLVNMTYYDPKAGTDYTKLAQGEIFVTVT